MAGFCASCCAPPAPLGFPRADPGAPSGRPAPPLWRRSDRAWRRSACAARRRARRTETDTGTPMRRRRRRRPPGRTRRAVASAWRPTSGSWRVRLLGGVERGGEVLVLAVIARTVPKARAADSGRVVAPDQLAVRILAQEIEQEQILGDDDVAFQAHHLGDVRDAARTVAQARRLDDDVDRRADHLADGPGRP